MVFEGPPVQFDTPVPLPQTMTWRQEHEQAARKESLTIHCRLGSGSQLFLFFRGLAEAASRPWLGVSVHDLDGTLLAGPEQGICDERSAFFALNLEVDPGCYSLRVEEEPGEVYEIFVSTLSGWQTQVFALAEQSWLPGVGAFRAALPVASVLAAAIGTGFDPSAVSVRQSELLRLGLLHGRNILAKAGLGSVLAEQPLNPMTAVFAAHVLLRQEDAALTAELVKHVDRCVVAAMPDLVAVLPVSGGLPVFVLPPMLRSSWQRIMEAAGKEKAAISPGSVVEQLKDGVLNTPLWLLRRR
jgi:hypothetical protein